MGPLTNTATLIKSGTGSNGNKWVISHSSEFQNRSLTTGFSFELYWGHIFVCVYVSGGPIPQQRMQLTYFRQLHYERGASYRIYDIIHSKSMNEEKHSIISI